MRFLVISLFFVTCSCLKISPFVPKEITKRELDIAKTEYRVQKRDLSAQSPPNPDRAENDQTTTNPDGAPKDDSDDTVPIVVGCLLAGLIAVVMISYFVLRA